MSSGINAAIVIAVALTIITATILFGGTTLELAAPAYGLVLLSLLLWAGKLLFARRILWKRVPLHLPVLAFLVYSLIRYFTSPIEYDARYELFMVLACGLLYFVVAFNVHHSRDRNVLFLILVGLALAEACYGIFQFATRATTVLHLLRPDSYQNRGSGTFICPNHLAGFLELAVGLALAYVALPGSHRHSVEKTALRKVFLFYAALLMLGGIMTTLSRSGWVATAIGTLTILVWGDWRSRLMWPRIAVATMSAGVLIFLAFKVPMIHDYITLTLRGSEGTIKDPSFGGRSFLWAATWDIIQEHPVVGTGPGTWQWFHLEHRRPQIQMFADYAHNDILNLASDYGLVGFMIVLLALVAYYRQTIWLTFKGVSSDQRAFAVGSLVGITMLLFHSWFDYNLHILSNALLFVVIMGLTVAMEDSANRFPHVEMKRPWRYALAGVLILTVLAGVRYVLPASLASWYLEKGRIASRALDWTAATNYYHRAISLDPKFPHPHAALADIYRLQAVFMPKSKTAEREALLQKAIAEYQKALALNPLFSDNLLRLSKAYEDAGQLDKAVETCLHMLKIDPENSYGYLQLGQYYTKMGKEPEAIKAFERARKYTLAPMPTATINLEELQKKQ